MSSDFNCQLTGDFPKLRLCPESLRDSLATELPLRVTFQTDSDGPGNGLLVYPPRDRKHCRRTEKAPKDDAERDRIRRLPAEPGVQARLVHF